MRKLLMCLVIPALLSVPANVSAGELKVSMSGGLVTIVADDVPLSAVLAEWSRIGKTKIVNGEQISSRVTLQLTNMPERKALDILLRSAAGYMVAERQVAVSGASAFDRIMILPTSRPPASSGNFTPPPSFTPPRPVTPVPEVHDEPVNVMPPNMPPQIPQGLTPQQMGAPGPMNVPQPGQPPTAPLTAPRPGMLTPPGPSQPVPFGAPPKPPGGGGGQ